MNSAPSTIKTFALRAQLIITCITIGFSSFTLCHAQSIVGKWKAISSKDYFDAESIKKADGREFMESSLQQDGVSTIIEYKSDHTFVTNTFMMNKIYKSGGTWVLAGDQLKIVIDSKYKPMKGQESFTATVLINGNKMASTSVFNKNNWLVEGIIKSETTFTKM